MKVWLNFYKPHLGMKSYSFIFVQHSKIMPSIFYICLYKIRTYCRNSCVGRRPLKLSAFKLGTTPFKQSPNLVTMYLRQNRLPDGSFKTLKELWSINQCNLSKLTLYSLTRKNLIQSSLNLVITLWTQFDQQSDRRRH